MRAAVAEPSGPKPKLPQAEIHIGIDVSGSTNNAHSGPRAGTRFDAQSEEFDPDQSDVIIVAEITATLLLLEELARRYDLEGARVVLNVFSTGVVEVLARTIGSAEGCVPLGRLLRELPAAVAGAYSMGSTNLWGWLESALGGSGPRVLIVATDGVPNVGGYPDTILARLAELPETERARFTTFVIGAGSVRLASDSGARRITCDRSAEGPPRFDLDGSEVTFDQLVGRLGVGAGAECDVAFLFRLMQALGRAAYLPACRNYDEFLSALGEFLGQVGDAASAAPPRPRSRVWSVLLDGGSARLPDPVQGLLGEGKPCVGYSPPARSWYLYVPTGANSGWQVALADPPGAEAAGLRAAGGAPATVAPAVAALTFGAARWRKSEDLVTASGTSFAVGRDACGFWRCRQLTAC